jgi:hypothetical protein
MALTLLEASKINPGTVTRDAVIEMFVGATDLMLAMQWMDITGGSYAYTQDGSLPGVAFRGINEGYAESVGVLNPQVEVLRIVGGDLDFDKALIKMHGEQARSTHERMQITAKSLYMTKKLIKGDSAANIKEFDGLQNRITGSQLISSGTTNGGDPLSLIKLDEAIDAVDNPTHLVMNKAMRRILTAAARDTSVGGFISYDVDALGRKVTKYQDLPILIADYDELGARYLDFDEIGAGGSTATATSIYCLSIGDGKLMGLQNGMPEVKDLGEIDAKPVLRTRMEWLAGFATLHGRCASRLYGISNAPAVD